MKPLLFGCFLVLYCNLFAQDNNPYQFVSPKPASIMVSNETNIILRHSDIIDQTTIFASAIKVTGSKSGEHTGELILSHDDRTIVYNPDETFAAHEIVNVEIEGLLKINGEKVTPFSFLIRKIYTPAGNAETSNFPEPFSSFSIKMTLPSTPKIS